MRNQRNEQRRSSLLLCPLPQAAWLLCPTLQAAPSERGRPPRSERGCWCGSAARKKKKNSSHLLIALVELPVSLLFSALFLSRLHRALCRKRYLRKSTTAKKKICIATSLSVPWGAEQVRVHGGSVGNGSEEINTYGRAAEYPLFSPFFRSRSHGAITLGIRISTAACLPPFGLLLWSLLPSSSSLLLLLRLLLLLLLLPLSVGNVVSAPTPTNTPPALKFSPSVVRIQSPRLEAEWLPILRGGRGVRKPVFFGGVRRQRARAVDNSPTHLRCRSWYAYQRLHDVPQTIPAGTDWLRFAESIPVYNLVHTIREDVQRTLDTSLTWDQLRSPQVSSFIVKPVLGRLLQVEGRLSKGIIYSLMANCLQFRKEAEENPRNAATSKTRALLCELLAIKFLKEFSARELVRHPSRQVPRISLMPRQIDALSYDFYPLQGMEQTVSADQKSGPAAPKRSPTATASRISALEIAIRAQVGSGHALGRKRDVADIWLRRRNSSPIRWSSNTSNPSGRGTSYFIRRTTSCTVMEGRWSAGLPRSTMANTPVCSNFLGSGSPDIDTSSLLFLWPSC